MRNWQQRMLQAVWIVLVVVGIIAMLPFLGSIAGVVVNVIVRNKYIAFLMGVVLVTLGVMVYVGSHKVENAEEENDSDWLFKSGNPKEYDCEDDFGESDFAELKNENCNSEATMPTPDVPKTNTSSDVKTVEAAPKEQAKKTVVNESVGVHTATPKEKVGGWPEY